MLRTGYHWNALRSAGICTTSSAHRRSPEGRSQGSSNDSGCWGRRSTRNCGGFSGCTRPWIAPSRKRRSGERTGANSTDRGKTGAKRSLLVNGRGVPLGAARASANCNDHLLVLEAPDIIPAGCPYPSDDIEIGAWLDKGHDIDGESDALRQNGHLPHIMPRDVEQVLKENVPGYIARSRLMECAMGLQRSSCCWPVRWETNFANSWDLGFIAFEHAAWLPE